MVLERWNVPTFQHFQHFSISQANDDAIFDNFTVYLLFISTVKPYSHLIRSYTQWL